ncbi:hypothetical protein [Salipaludibacillus agaradhaerens]|uniref:hypothetical protein n=1 Tax=Salipaludibacillus agaradhaerens TaxID=76935 RepID=UPI0009966235|nr:hypothetical protein [Salipaludibacillus agaradhaerens]
MTKRHLKLVITVLIIMTIIFSIIKYNEAKEKKLEEVWERDRHEIVVNNFRLGAYYERLDDGSIEVTFYPTAETQTVVDRWKIAAEALPVIEYPEDLISENKWLEAYDILRECLTEYENYRDTKEKEEREKLDKQGGIRGFIYNDSVSDNLQQAFEEAGIDYEKEAQ